jgi:primosomal protein N' (replication factor Y)
VLKTAQVVPDLATFAVDDGFAYAVPEGSTVDVGSIVRVPLGSRRVRGFVVATRDIEPAGLKEIAAVSGDFPVFDGRLLETLRWAALHYVAPLSVLLAKTAPPNLPRGAGRDDWEAPPAPLGDPLLTSIAHEKRIQPVHLITADNDRIRDLIAASLSAGRSSLVVVPTVAEGSAAAANLRDAFGGRIATASSTMAAAKVTKAWVDFATASGSVLVATREAVWWPGADLGLALVLGEGRRAMKDRQTPTVHVRDVLRRRGAVERFLVIGTGPVPTAETIAAGVEVIDRPGRNWPLTEIIDRTEDPPGTGAVGERARSALRNVARLGGPAFVLCLRRGDSVRCVKCRALRQCRACATSLGRADACARCGAEGGSCSECGGERFESAASSVPAVLAEIATVVGAAAGTAGSGTSIVVGTERDLPPAASVDLAIAIDGDSAVFAANFRAAEEALRLLARLATTVRRGRSNRAIVQTSRPDHPVYEALRRGSASEFISRELARRRADGFPPAGELVVIEVENPVATSAEDLERAVGGEATILGPAATGARQRWLIHGRDLRRAKVALRPIVQAWRESKARVRIDVDPIDL